ncbi:hypothetical protein Tsp_07624 [Trichinella spiralis]|uniref:hypothetical protein n=1 Tax=Trichinella spiralis TaxID=6334 RepID=UPI0001EFC221|nr:hypothetical protein Tsp_07624 [Trichinella spiralis]
MNRFFPSTDKRILAFPCWHSNFVEDLIVTALFKMILYDSHTVVCVHLTSKVRCSSYCCCRSKRLPCTSLQKLKSERQVNVVTKYVPLSSSGQAQSIAERQNFLFQRSDAV